MGPSIIIIVTSLFSCMEHVTGSGYLTLPFSIIIIIEWHKQSIVRHLLASRETETHSISFVEVLAFRKAG